MTATAVLALVACGGGGGTAAPATLSGVVIDGYIKGAKVCLDINSNAVCDSNEPTATTDVNGAYTLTYDGSVAGMHIIAEVPVGAVDADLGVVSKTYSLFAPAASAATVTPLSTLVSSEMISTKVSAVDAEKTVKVNLNLTSISLLNYDFVKVTDSETIKLAQVITAAIASVNDTLTKDTTIKAANLTSGDISKQAIAQVKNSILPQVIKADGKLALIGDATSLASQIAAISTTTISGNINNIVAETKSGDGITVVFADLFKNGFITARNDSGLYVDINNILQSYNNKLEVEYIKIDLAALSAPFNGYSYRKINVNNKWETPYISSESWIFDGANWVLGSDLTAAKPVASGNCVNLFKDAAGKVVETYCATSKNLSNKKITDFIPNICSNGAGGVISGCDNNSVFPLNSFAYDLTMSTSNDEYYIYANIDAANGGWGGYQTTPPNSSKIEDFIAYTKVNEQYKGGNCNTAFLVKSYDAVNKIGIMGWASTGSINCSGINAASLVYKAIDDTNFSVVNIGGKDILKLEVSSVYRINNPGDNSIYTIFGYQSGTKHNGIWNGNFNGANYKKSIPFNGNIDINTQIVSPVLFDAYLKMKGLTAYPYF